MHGGASILRTVILATAEFNIILIIRPDLDRSNVSNAYVSGMKEELNMVGNEFNARTQLCIYYSTITLFFRKSTQYSPVVTSLEWFQVCFFYVKLIAFIEQHQDNLMLQVVSPRIWLPMMQLIWGVLTFWCGMFQTFTFANLIGYISISTSSVHSVEQVRLAHQPWKGLMIQW